MSDRSRRAAVWSGTGGPFLLYRREGKRTARAAAARAESSVDPENEHELIAAIGELTRGKTLVSIAHRLNTVAGADQILVVDEGRIVQRGTHDQLMGEQGLYRDFVNLRREAAGWRLAG